MLTSMGKTSFLPLIVLFLICNAVAQTSSVNVLLDFTGKTGSYEGNDPKGSMIMSGSTLYGFTSAGGANDGGVIFSYDAASNNYSILASFSSNDDLNGSQPHHGYLTLVGSTITRPMFQGGDAVNNGTIFSVQTNGTGAVSDYIFSGSSNSPTPLGDGSQPHSGLLAAGGSLYYGMTAEGGTYGGGTIFSYNASNNAVTTVYSFSTNADSSYDSHGQLIWNSSGTLLLGMTRDGGSGIGNTNTGGSAPGVIFSFNPANSAFTTLYNFTSSSNNPYFTDHGILTLGTRTNASTIFGMTEYGGMNDKGAIFSLSESGSSTLTMLHSFGGNFDGANPFGSLVLNTSNGYLYGMTRNGGSSNDGTIFCINQDGSNYSVLASFSNSTGINPIDNITFNSNYTMLYGLTQSGSGSTTYGTMFSLSLVPEPSTFALFGLGAITLLMVMRRKKTA